MNDCNILLKKTLPMFAGLVTSVPGLAQSSLASRLNSESKPNIVLVITDQWRAQAMGYMGDPNIKTPEIDKIAKAGINFSNAISVCPVCTPARASLMTGRFPTTTGMFMNDLYLPAVEESMAEIFGSAGYTTGYIGKWHLDGHGRQVYIPQERRQGFEFWNVLECTHDYNHSRYFAGNDTSPRYWQGYDAFDQTRAAQEYIREHAGTKRPFLLVVAFGSPHAPHHTAPSQFKRIYHPDSLKLRDNVPPEMEKVSRQELVGYYGHCSALDSCVGRIYNSLQDSKIDRNTIFIFTSDHGEMMGSQGVKPFNKQRPWDESIRVPFLLCYPKLNLKGKEIHAPINTPDILPTLLGLAGLPVPSRIEGQDFSKKLSASGEDEHCALFMNVAPFGDIYKSCEFRGIRTPRYTYVRNPAIGSWLLYDNQIDPYQLNNLAGKSESIILEKHLNELLEEQLTRVGDQNFRTKDYYLKRWGYHINDIGGIPYTEFNQEVQTPRLK